MPKSFCKKDCCRDKDEIKVKEPSHLPGINHEPYFYTAVFFGAQREYGPEEGWQTVRHKKSRKAHQA